MAKETAVEVLDQAISYGFVNNISPKDRRVPGATIKRMSKQKREILKDLKSDDIKSVRIEYV